jgi:hypothetical protein
MLKSVAELPAVIILKTNDVVFAEIISSLHFYENEIIHPWVLDAVSSADGDVDRLTGVDEDFFAVARHFRRSFDYEPVLGAL